MGNRAGNSSEIRVVIWQLVIGIPFTWTLLIPPRTYRKIADLTKKLSKIGFHSFADILISFPFI